MSEYLKAVLGDTEQTAVKAKLDDFIVVAVFSMLKAMAKQQGGANEFFKELINGWKYRQDSAFKKEIKKLNPEKGDPDFIASMLFGSLMPEIGDIEKSHNEAVAKVVEMVENFLIEPDA